MRTWSSADGLVRVVIDESVATITLDNAANRNCVSLAMSLAVVSAVDYVNASSDVSVAILTAVGPVFAAGSEVGPLASPGDPLAGVSVGSQALGKLVMPSIAAVNGPATGAGVNFAIACDVIVAARSAVFESSFLDAAIHPDGGHLWHLNRLAGRQATAAIVIFGERLSAEQAQAIGMVWSVVDDDQLMEEALRLARRVTARSNDLVRRTKATLIASLPITTERVAVDLEQAQREWSVAQPAFLEVTQVSGC